MCVTFYVDALCDFFFSSENPIGTQGLHLHYPATFLKVPESFLGILRSPGLHWTRHTHAESSPSAPLVVGKLRSKVSVMTRQLRNKSQFSHLSFPLLHFKSFLNILPQPLLVAFSRV